MEPIDYDTYNRHDALSFAIQASQGRPLVSVEGILETAQLFLNWLNEVEVN